ncbi:NAD-dependent deacetylase CobB [Peptoclostridium acidaminophilum DSM 3953]|uniref:NAD-dependent protein deacetylase n=1 Tax=Peptoclostridium acidaminophilum DSM 3953 TaxID=1286171 RepID=W8TK34_PEPAC|nr:NAD-dependent protein deacylase [Peptoclostridium acidaminophilum]AHM56562.1 NAD-dependent deacetylase CobB [Peptoclostridium acidaminophilum DSM 3953]
MDESINRLSNIIKSSRDIVFFGGAGVSTESNIPDFRSENGLYRTASGGEYPPETMLSRSFFDAHTLEFYEFYREKILYPDAKPNKAHYALAQMERNGNLKAIVTQNIDGLHQAAGSRNVIELHGSVLRNYCTSCKAFYDLDYIISSSSTVPMCSACRGLIKPDVVLYEEALDETVIEDAVSAIAQADTLIVGGTSLVVYPAAGLLRYFKGSSLVLINKSSTQYDSRASLVIKDSIGSVLSKAVFSK